ncbi:radical SAM family heme chaperone HemW [Flavobacterium psychrophilum]|uniref:Heme chaperone HemW n=1 Tax=Flavobacterium psychrophilum TaxID=96345 RepID=A0A7U2RAM5_FLAPS|nr:radical SAM family heme chaperone HemW [Flavobacterium psychrophilum]EKT3965711.1 radical SAM family heme chaperone HemW [Flavobacterium psychrophilum]EKT4498974.1 radical SAM family heme chaperone HemW [Flavobacterium psychrophilum]EKT4510197.1 radical SAM family heme chaperone HemW [Flavobacterium psychrophilum]MCB6088986.1 radical SAM family heme chaperone HemW [Flavobacterium psychrophilum]QRE04459.1 radical SAM family heme chaperone HemW [Flavobacterium psychrophilum]
MAGIYIHIPFCKQACHYCDFHFSTSLKKKDEMVLAIAKEIAMRKNEFKNQTIETIYFGGGTPSLLNVSDLMFLINQVYSNYNVSQNTEITIEANPDDLSENRIIELSKTPINRLSIGIQSFFEEDLQLMNRAHNSAEAKKCLEIATQYFDNISVDLIYGTPGMSNERWLENIKIALDLNIPHISSYALTVEPKTALHKFIKDGMMPQLDDAMAHEQFLILVDTLETNKFIHYELSNFGKENYFSKNNSAYWLGKKYIGVGPSAHSYDGKNRSWNLSNNGRYLKSISENTLPSETETLSKTDKYNEYIMTGLRTIWGVSLNKIESEFGEKYLKYLLKNTQKYLDDTKLILENNILRTTRKGKFFCDGIASDLFYLDLE